MKIFPASSFLASCFGLAVAAMGCLAAPEEADRTGEAIEALVSWPAHVAQAQTYVDQINNNDQINNLYGTPAFITYDAGGVLHATTKCGSFVAQLLEHTYPGTVTSQTLLALTGSTSPDSSHWYSGIDPAVPHTSYQGVSLAPIDAAAAVPTGRTMSYLQVGDILTAMYDPGHVVLIGAIAPASGVISLSGSYPIPGVPNVKRWLAHVFDSTTTVHGNVPGSTDSRYHTDPTQPYGNNQGIGSGDIYLYEDATTGSSTYGQIVGWTWSTISSVVYQGTSASATYYRPVMVGRMSGGGL